nr:MAG TPA: minor tail protein [Bacteriophage sp.]
MATEESLELEIEASAKKANAALDSLIKKLGAVSSAIGGVDTSALGNFAKNINGIAKNGGLKDAKSAIDGIDKSVKNLGKRKTKVNVDTKTGMAAISALQEKFSEIGKDAKFDGSTVQLQKEYDKLSAKLDNLAEKEKKALATGSASTGKSSFVNMQYDISETINKMDALSKKMKEMATSQKQIQINRSDNGGLKNTKAAQPKTSYIPKSAVGYSDSLMQTIEETKKAEKSANEYGDALNNAKQRLKELSSQGYSAGDKEWNDAYLAVEKLDKKVRDYKEELKSGLNPNLDGISRYTAMVQDAKSYLASVEQSGLGMGTSEWDTAYMALAKVTDEAKRYKAALNQKAKGITTDITETDSLDTKVSKLRANLKKMQSAGIGFGNEGFDKSYQELVKAESELKTYKKTLNDTGKDAGSFQKRMIAAFSNIGKNIKASGASISSFFSRIKSGFASQRKLSSGFGGIASKLTKLVIGVNAAKGAFNGLKSAMDYSSNLTEVQNVVDVGFGKYKSKIEDLAKTSIQDYGMSELTAKQIAGRFQAMGTAVGFSQKKMSGMSTELTKLSADMASFYNEDQEKVAKSLQSVFTGTTMPLRKYGIDLTQATLQEWAHKQGIDANIKSMSQAEKTMLRYQYVISQTGAAQGDFARTSNTWANQTRMLQQNFQQLGSTIGQIAINAFKPFVKAMNSTLVQLDKFAKSARDALGKIFGWEYEEGGGVTQNYKDDMEDAADGANDTADATKKATKAQKEFNKQLQGFDRLNNLTSSKGKDNDGDGKGIGTSVGKLSNIGSGSGGKWKQKDSIFKKFESDIDTLEKLGKKISATLSKAMEDIDWKSIYQKAAGFGTGLASFLNGLFAGGEGARLFSDLGSTIANSLNTALTGLNSFATTFSWDEFGRNLGIGINGFFTTWDAGLTADTFNNMANGVLTAMTSALNRIHWDLIAKRIGELIKGIDAKGIGENFGKLVNSMVNALYTLVSNKETWKDLGTKIGDGINGFFKGFGKSGWKKLGKTISNTFSGFVTTITTALNTVDWDYVGQCIGDFLSGIDFGKVAIDLAKLALAIGKAIAKAIKGSMETAPIETSIIGIFAILKFTGLGKTIFKTLATKVMTKIAEAIGVESVGVGTIAKAAVKGIGKAITKVPSVIGTFISSGAAATAASILASVAAAVGAAFVGWNIGKLIGDAIMSDEQKKYAYKFKFKDLFTYSPEEWKQGLADWWVDVEDYWGKKTLKVKTKFEATKEKVAGWWSDVKDWWGDKAVSVKSKLSTKASEISKWWKNVKDWWGDKALKIKSIFSMDTLKSGINTLIGWINSKIIDNLNKISLKLPKALGGKTLGFNINHIATFETGGTPKIGELFYARENGKPELVGRQGNRTKVINNDQIIASTSKGVADAVYNVMTPVLTSLVVAINKMNSGNGQALYVEGVSDGDIVRITTDANEKFKKTNGRPLYA